MDKDSIEAIKYISECLKPSKELEDNITKLFDIIEEKDKANHP